MKNIFIASVHPKSGQTTITLNLASGLVREGYRVLIIDIGHNEKLYNWLGINYEQDNKINNSDDIIKAINTSLLGIDWINMPRKSKDIHHLADFLPKLEQDYDYLLIIPTSKSDCNLLNELSAHVLLCSDLSHNNEVADIISINKYLNETLGLKKSISLLVFNKINTKEWEHNTEQIFELADYLGYEKMADPIPYCERIHDLQLEKHTIWELSQKNLQAAFMSLIETVVSLQI
ncbi:MAG TPA: hypothetical protein VFC73_03865 [Syntrophomonadaceae bacterium]|nr:hypothetical protein [Syntrophomonadaceae bacterium]